MIAEKELILKKDEGVKLGFEDNGMDVRVKIISPLSEIGRELLLELSIEREEGKSAYPFRRVCRGGTKDHDFILLHRDGETLGFVEREYEINIPLRIDGGVVHTHYPENSLNLFILDNHQRIARMYQYSLVGRCNSLFLVRQLLFECEISEGGGIFFPKHPWMDFKPWARIWEEEVVRRVLQRWNWNIPKCEGPRRFSPFLPKNGEKKALILWFNIAMGYGYASLADGRVVRIHWSQLPKGWLYLRAGSLVNFEKLDLHESGRNREIISQLIGIRPL